MGEAQEVQIHVVAQEANNANLLAQHSVSYQPTVQRSRKYKKWFRIAVNTFFVLSGQTVATLLGRQYYDKGGNSKWLATLVQLVGFPILFPCYCIPQRRNPNAEIIHTKPPSIFILASVYITIGLLLAANCFMYSVGLLYLPVSTYSLICASQLAFNSFFSFFLNAQKFTPYIINSIVLLTISSTLLVFQNDSDNTTRVSKQKYAIGFICTVGASAGNGLLLSLTQLAFTKVVKRQTFKAVLDMIIYTNFVASCAIVVGLFASKEGMTLGKEMKEYQLGKVSYAMNLVWTAITWQLYSLGITGLIFEISSLFSNSISVLGLPVVPILAVVFFHDKMDGLKVITMVLAIWGFVSFVYQNYLDDRKFKTDNRNANLVSQKSSTASLTVGRQRFPRLINQREIV